MKSSDYLQSTFTQSMNRRQSLKIIGQVSLLPTALQLTACDDPNAPDDATNTTTEGATEGGAQGGIQGGEGGSGGIQGLEGGSGGIQGDEGGAGGIQGGEGGSGGIQGGEAGSGGIQGGEAGIQGGEAGVEGGTQVTMDGWARGGTANMGERPLNPFQTPAENCRIAVANTTAGPCTTEEHIDREDISEGWRGLPVWVALRIVDASCTAQANAQVRLWHTNIEGSYSGQTPSAICVAQPEHAMTNFFRGVQSTDEEGVVYFKTCYPGWYPGRAIHMHFQVLINGISTKVSQLFFAQDLTASIFNEHIDYAPFGSPDTTVSRDGVVRPLSASELAALTFEVSRLDQGIMLASKTIQIR